jgi:hypothetical protein
MIPWGYGTERPEDYNDLIEVSKSGADALERVFGK